MEQRSPEWFEIRLGKFTSSEIYKLLTNGRTKGQEFGESAMTYIKEKVHEQLTKGTCMDYEFQGNNATRWGEQFEPEAREFYSKLTGNEVTECGFILSQESEMFGGSPDGLVGEDGIIEIKCPYGSNHVNFLTYTPEEFILNEKPYYAQIQGNLLATNRKWCDFISYDPRYQNDKFKMRIIRLERDEEFISNMLDKIKKAESVYNDFLDKIINNIN